MAKQLQVQIYIFKIIIFICILSHERLFAQSKYSPIEEGLIDSFNYRLNPQTRLFNGGAYLGYFGKLEGNAYLDDNSDFVRGSVTYDGFEFKDVPLLFDLVEEKVISLTHDGYNRYALLNQRLSNFTIAEKKFINISFANLKDANIDRHGIFELVYGGQIQVLIKRVKLIKEMIELQGSKKVFYQKTEYFILRNSQLHKINNEAALLRLFEGHKVELKKYLRSQKLKFKEDPSKTLVSLVSYYEQLLN